MASETGNMEKTKKATIATATSSNQPLDTMNSPSPPVVAADAMTNTVRPPCRSYITPPTGWATRPTTRTNVVRRPARLRLEPWSTRNVGRNVKKPRMTMDNSANALARTQTSDGMPPRNLTDRLGGVSVTVTRILSATSTHGMARRNSAVRQPKAVTSTATPTGAMNAPTEPPQP